MKRLNLTWFFAFAFLGLGLLSGCNKDNKGEELTTIMDIPGATYSEKALPRAKGKNKPVIENVQTNVNVIPGGGAPFRVDFSGGEGSDWALLVKVVNYSGHFRYEFDPTTVNSLMSVYISGLMNQTLPVGETLTFWVALTDGENVSEREEVEVTVLEVGTGVLQVSLSFDQSTDLDLYLVEPDGEVIYYGSSASSNGGLLDLDSNPACYQDNVNNENITYDNLAQVESGQYTVRVNNYADCVQTRVNYSVTARYNGTILDTYSGFFEAGTATPGGQDAGQQVFQFNIANGQAGSRTVPQRVASYKPN